jgi:flagellar biosynthesis/type III secretory pathway chaperone
MTPAPTRSNESIETLMAALSGALAEEYDALRKRDIDHLEAAIASKSTLVAALESAMQSIGRAGGLEEAGVSAGEVSALRTLASECQLANRANGGAIELNRRLVANLLDTLYGVSRTGQTYDACGRVDQSEAARSVAQA